MEIDRRKLLVGSISAIVGSSVLTGALADALEFGAPQRSGAELKALHAKIKEMLAALDLAPYKKGQYTPLFDYRRADRAIERVSTLTFADARQVRVIPDTPEEEYYIYNFVPREVGLGFAAVPGKETTDATLLETIKGLAGSFRECREICAAQVFNCGKTYDPEIGADGQPLLSLWHPHSNWGGVWANTFAEYKPLTASSLKEAFQLISNFVDERGIKTMAQPKRLVVPIMQWDAAEKAIADLREEGVPGIEIYVYDHLLDEDSWYITTDVNPPIHFDRVPLEMDAWIDYQRMGVLVKGYERGCFGYHDPRSIFGVMRKALKPIKWAWNDPVTDLLARSA